MKETRNATLQRISQTNKNLSFFFASQTAQISRRAVSTP